MNKTKFTDLKSISRALENKLDTLLKDVEIRAYWWGLKDAGVPYSDAIELTQNKFIISKSQVKKALYEKEQV